MIKLIQNQFTKKFVEEFGGSATGLKVFFAPGRVNLIGEHTDYNGGYVFPAALTYGIWACVRKRDDQKVRLRSTNFDLKVDCELDQLEYNQQHDWANYPKGVLHEFKKLGVTFNGMDILYFGNIPNGAGLSSSAAIELVTAIAVNSIYELHVQQIELIKLAQRAENHFVGVNCGIMDQFAVGMGKENHALYLNCRTLEYEHVPMKIDGYKLVITNTNKRRGLADSKYNERRKECEEGLKQLKRFFPDLNHLGQISLPEWLEIQHQISDKIVRKRVEHVIQENDRVKRSKDLLKNYHIEAFGELMMASHDSLRDLYEVTGVELDTLYNIARQIPGCIGTRMTGAGFGGCTVSLVEEEKVDQFKHVVQKLYEQKIGYPPSFYVCDIGDGAKEITQEVESWQS